MAFLKLKDIETIEVANVSAAYWLHWDGAKYNRYKIPTQGGQQKWDVITPNRDRIQISKDQMGQMLVAVLDGCTASIKDCSFNVKTNGKEGKEIRYFLNLKE